MAKLFGPFKSSQENLHQKHTEEPRNRPDDHTCQSIEEPHIDMAKKSGKSTQDRYGPESTQKKIDEKRKSSGFEAHKG